MLLKACVHYFLTNFYFSPSDSSSETMKDKKKLYCPFLWMDFNCLKARATLRRQFTFSTRLLEIPGTHSVDLGRMKG